MATSSITRVNVIDTQEKAEKFLKAYDAASKFEQKEPVFTHNFKDLSKADLDDYAKKFK